MRKLFLTMPFLVVVVLTAGCPPWTPRNQDAPKFTSADLYRGSRWANGAWSASTLTDGNGTGDQETQPRDVVEPDVIRQAGNLLYVLNQYRGLTVVNLETQTILAQVPTYGYPRDLYIKDNRAYVLVGQASNFTTQGNTISFTVQARLYVVDIADPSASHILSTFDLEGDLVDSRLVGHVLYAVCAQFQWAWDQTTVVKDATSDSWVTSVNVADPNAIHEADTVTFPGAGNVIQATDSAIFVASSAQWWSTASSITYVDISDPDGAMAVRGSASVQGYVADRFKMNVWNGVLRVASNAWSDQRRVYITTIDLADPDHLTVLAETHLDRAVGDTLFATRFDGPRGYVVTYLVKDPLFVLDLSNPAAPTVLGELEVPGWSTYIEPRGDRLIALGVDDTNGRRVCVSLFNVADPAGPSLVERVTFGDQWSWSSAYDDVKSLTVFDDLLIVPFSGYTDQGGAYERLQFVSWTPDDLAVRGSVDLAGAAIRSFKYGDAYYGVTAEQLATIEAANLDQPAVTNRLVLAENIADFLELTPEVGVELVSRYDTGVTVVRTVGLAKGLGEAKVEIGQLLKSYVHGNSVVLVGSAWKDANTSQSPYSWYWSGTQYYKVAIVDCSTPAQPQVVDTLTVDVEPYSGWYTPLALYDMVGAVGADRASILPYPWYPGYNQDMTFLLGDTLVLRCWSDEFDAVLGGGTPYEGFALVDLTVPEWTSTVGLGYSEIVSLNAAGGKLYLGTRQTVEQPLNGSVNPECAYFVTQITLGGVPSAGPTANVPGVFVQYDPANDLLTLRDDQWVFVWQSRGELRTVKWDGAGAVELLDSLELPDGTSQILGRGAKVYLDNYNNGCNLYAVSVAPAGDLHLSDPVLVTNEWASLIDAHGTSAYMSVGGGAVALYDFSGGQGALSDLVPVMGSPMTIRFGTAAAYASCGYSGIVKLPL